MILKYNKNLEIWEVRVGPFISYAPTRKAAMKLGLKLCSLATTN